MKNILLLVLLCAYSSLHGQVFMSEDFNYTDSLSKNGWTPMSAWGTNGLFARATGLVKTGYIHSGIGNAVTMAISGEDSKRDLSTAIGSGNVYASFLINVKTAAKTAGSYVLGFTSGASGGSYNLRYYIKSDSAGGIYFGIGKSTGTAIFSTSHYAFNTTYLVTMKYGFNASAAQNDTVAFYIHPTASVTSLEPTEYTVNNKGTGGGSDASEINAFYLRQGAASDSIALTVDGIRVSNTWAGSITKVLAVNSVEKVNFRVYPSVTKDIVNFEFGEVKNSADISVINMQGQVLMQKKCPYTEGGQTMDLSYLPNGSYIVRLVSNETVLTQFIEKQ